MRAARMGRYASVEQAKNAGAVGTDTEIEAALADGEIIIERYCRDVFAPTPLGYLIPVDVYGGGYLPVTAYTVDVGTLGYDGRTWTADGYSSYATGTEFLVTGYSGWRTTPAQVSAANARLAARPLPGALPRAARAGGHPERPPPRPHGAGRHRPGPATGPPGQRRIRTHHR